MLVILKNTTHVLLLLLLVVFITSLRNKNATLLDIVKRQEDVLVKKCAETQQLKEININLANDIYRRDAKIMEALTGSPDIFYAAYIPEVLRLRFLLNRGLNNPYRDAVQTAIDFCGNKIPPEINGHQPPSVAQSAIVLASLSKDLKALIQNGGGYEGGEEDAEACHRLGLLLELAVRNGAK